MTHRQREIKELLQFSDRWLELGMLTVEELDALADAYEASDDHHAEHYRHGVFCRYVAGRQPLAPETASTLYRLGGEDPDPALAGAMMHDVLRLPECPEAVIDQALASGEAHLVRLAQRKSLLNEIDTGLTAELFDQCITTGDASLQRELLNRVELSKLQLERLSDAGATRVVRNLAVVTLKRIEAGVPARTGS